MIIAPSSNTGSAVILPSSKSIASRSLILAFMTGQLPDFTPDCEDVEHLYSALRSLQAYLRERREGNPDFSPLPCKVYLGEGAAPFRFFTALAASIPGVEVEISIAPALARRPQLPLLKALTSLGARIEVPDDLANNPIRVKGKSLPGGYLKIDATTSSQFVSALMMVAPLWENDTMIDLGTSRPVSAAYLNLTADMMRHYGITPRISDQYISIPHADYRKPDRSTLEPDWSAAAFFFTYALLNPGKRVFIEKLTDHRRSLQGDAFCAGIFDALGVTTLYCTDGSASLQADAEVINSIRKAKRKVTFDLSATPDLVPALAVGMALSGIPFKFTGIGHLRHKESNRMESISQELEKLGIRLSVNDNSMEWDGDKGTPQPAPVIDSHGDHRIAMAFAVAAGTIPGLTVSNPEVVGKSFPRFREELLKLGIRS